MSSTLCIYWSFGGVVDGISYVGEGTSMVVPVQEVTITGNTRIARQFTLAANTAAVPYTEPTVLWEWRRQGDDFDFCAVQIMGGSGYINIAWKLDAPTDAGVDDTATDNKDRWQLKGVSCQGPEFFTADSGPVHSDLATATGTDADGHCAMLTTAGATVGKIYVLEAQNTSITTAVNILLWMR